MYELLGEGQLDFETVSRLETIAKVEKGWLEGDDGEVVEDNSLRITVRFLEEFSKRSYHTPLIFPAEEGGVSLQWYSAPTGSLSDRSWIVEFFNNWEIDTLIWKDDHYEYQELTYTEENADEVVSKIIGDLDQADMLQ